MMMKAGAKRWINGGCDWSYVFAIAIPALKREL